MANELIINYPTGATLYALLFDSTGQIWNGSSFVAPASASWTDYDIAMSEVATATGVYRGTMPAAAAGVYGWTVRKQVGGSPAVADIAVGVGRIEWDGTAEIMPASTTNITSGTINSVSGSIGSIAADGISAAAVSAAAAAKIATAVIAGGATTFSYSNTVDDGSGNLLDGVFVQCATDSAFTNIVSTATTNSLGAFTVYDDTAGAHYLRLQLSGYTFAIQTVVLT